MKAAVTYDVGSGEIFQHFGKTEMFKVYEIENGQVKGFELCPTNGKGHGALAGFLQQAGVDTLVCGGIGEGARNALAEIGVAVYAGNNGSADEAANALAAGTLTMNSSATCDHHGHDHGEGHSCGAHKCHE